MRFTLFFAFSILGLVSNAQSILLNDTIPVFQFIQQLNNSSPEANLTPAVSVGADVLWGKGYEGDGLYAGVWEAGGNVNIYDNFSDLSDGIGGNRVQVIEGTDTTNHTNRVGRILASDGTSPGADKGIAPKSYLLSYNINTNDYLTEMANVAYPAGTGHDILVSNNSFAASAGWNTNGSTYWNGVFEIDEREDFKFGRYSDLDWIFDDVYDQTIYNNPYLSIVKAAGNDRAQSGVTPYTQWQYNGGLWARISGTLISPDKPETDGGLDGFDCIPNGATGKNIITVGVCNQLAAAYTHKSQIILGANSGFGPTDDGRIKPDLVAPDDNGKTSYSTPVVSGVVLLVQEMYKAEVGPDFMKASTVKALLCHTAHEADNDGPDYKTGWGMVNAAGAGEIIENNNRNIIEASLADGDSNLFYYYVPNSSTETKVTLAWTDVEGSAVTLTYTPTDLNNTTSMLVNDLDLRVIKLCDGTELEPYILDPSNPATAATTGDNFRDNIEQVHRTSTDAGWYAIRVKHKSNLNAGANQDYSLIIEGFETPNIWDGSSWSAGSAPTSLSTASIEGNLTISGTTIQAQHLNIAANSTISTSSSTSILEVNGNLSGYANAAFTGDGHILLNGNSANVCGQLEVSNLDFDKTSPNTVTISGGNSNLAITELLTLKSGSGTLVTNSNLTLQANSNVNQEGYAQVLDNGGTISGHVNAQAYIIGNAGWRQLSSPVTTTLNNFLQDYDTYLLTDDASAYKWSNSTSKWTYVSGTSEAVNASTAFNLWFGTSGTTVYTGLPHLIELTGPLTTGAVTNNLNYHEGDPADFGGDPNGWNMIGNPYPSGLDWSTIQSGFGSVQISDFYYLYDAATDNYYSHDGTAGTGSLNGVIAPYQAFFIKLVDNTANGSTVLDFDNSDRTTTKTKFLKKEMPQITLKVASTQNKIDITSIWFNPLATPQFDIKYDAYKLPSPTKSNPKLYSITNYRGVNQQSSIQSIPVVTVKTKVSLGFSADIIENYTISLDSVNLDSHLDIWLLDIITNSRTNLSKADYNFKHQPNNRADRFVLFMGPDLDQSEIVLSSKPRAYITGETLIVNGLNNNRKGTIQIYNTIGQIVFEQSTSQQETLKIDLNQLNVHGTVIVNYIYGNGSFSQKVLIP